MRRFLSNKALQILLLTNALILIAGAMLGPIYALFVAKVGGNLLDAGLTAGMFAIAAGVTTLFAGRFSDKLREKDLILVFGYVVMGIGFFSYIFVNSIYSLFIVQAVIGFAEAFYSPTFDSLYAKHVNIKKVGQEWGMNEAAYYFSTAIGAILGGVIANTFGFNVLFVIMSLFCFASAIYIYYLPRNVL